MPIFTYVVVVGSALIALLFVMGATPEKAAPPIVTSDRVGLPKPWHPDPIQILTAAPAPPPDMTSGAVLAAQPKVAPEAEAKPRRRTRRSVLPAGSRRTSTGRATAGRESHSAGSSAAFKRRCNRRILGVPIPTLGNACARPAGRKHSKQTKRPVWSCAPLTRRPCLTARSPISNA